MGTLRLLCAAALMLPAALAGQDAPRGNDTVFAQAQRLVAEGRGEEGRALVERTLASAAAGSAEYAAALYWRGVMAPTASEAERDLRRVIVEFPLSAHADDALLRLAQLEIARGDRVAATRHLDRLLSEHPASEQRPRAQLTMARMQLDAGQASAGCATLRAAAASAPQTEIELRNQIAFLQQRCAGTPADTRVAETRTSPGDVAPTPRKAGPVDTAGRARPSPSDSAAPPPAAATTKPAAASASSGAAGFSVQVGAFGSRAQADKIQRDLAARGYSVRVVPGPRNLFRVRVGRYADRARADAALATMMRSGLNGMVVEAEPR